MREGVMYSMLEVAILTCWLAKLDDPCTAVAGRSITVTTRKVNGVSGHKGSE